MGEYLKFMVRKLESYGIDSVAPNLTTDAFVDTVNAIQPGKRAEIMNDYYHHHEMVLNKIGDSIWREFLGTLGKGE